MFTPFTPIQLILFLHYPEKKPAPPIPHPSTHPHAHLPWVYCLRTHMSLFCQFQLSQPSQRFLSPSTKISEFCSTKLMTEYKRMEQRKPSEFSSMITCEEVYFMSSPGVCSALLLRPYHYSVKIFHSAEPCLKLPHGNQPHQ